MVISKKYVFLLISFTMMVGIMFSVTDFFLADFGVKFKYIFILYCLADIISHKKRPCSRNLAFLFSLLILYVLVAFLAFLSLCSTIVNIVVVTAAARFINLNAFLLRSLLCLI